MKLKRMGWLRTILIVIFFLALLATGSLWKPWVMNVLYPNQTREDVDQIITIVTILTAIIFPAVGLFYALKHPADTSTAPTRYDFLPPTSVDKILNITPTSSPLTDWIPRQIINTADWQHHPLVVLEGAMKSGKTREGAELIRCMLHEGIVQSDQVYDLSEAVRTLSPELISSLFQRELGSTTRALFYLEEIPTAATPKYLEVVAECLKAIRKCSPGYFISTIRADALENAPGLRTWLKDQGVERVGMRLLTEDERARLTSNLLQINAVDWPPAWQRVLAAQTEGTPYHIIVTFQRLTDPHRAEPVNEAEITRLAHESLSSIWGEIEREVQKYAPAAPSLLNALAIFQQAQVSPAVPLIFALAADLERQKRSGLRRLLDWRAPQRVLQAARALQHYGVHYEDQAEFTFPDVIAENHPSTTPPLPQLEAILRRKSLLRSIDARTLARVFLRMGVIYYEQNAFPKAEAACRNAIEADPEFARAWVLLGNLLKSQQRFDEAEAAYRKAIEVDPEFAYAWDLLGDLLKSQQRFDQAEAAYRKAIEVDPEFAYAWVFLGNLLKSQQRFDEAEAAYRKAIEVDPKDAYAWDFLGGLLKSQQRFDEAEVALRKAIEVDPESARAWVLLGNLLNSQQRFDEAEVAYRKVIEADPKDAYAWDFLGDLLKSQQRFDEAEAAYRNAIEVDPEFAYAWCDLGDFLESQQRLPEAEDAFRKAIEIDPRDASLWHKLGALLYDQQRIDEAEAAYRKAVEIDPDFA